MIRRQFLKILAALPFFKPESDIVEVYSDTPIEKGEEIIVYCDIQPINISINFDTPLLGHTKPYYRFLSVLEK